MSINFVNILDVDIETQMEVRNWRNDESIRKYMLNDNIITEEEHKNWLESLAKTKQNMLFLACLNEDIIGVASIINADYTNKTCSWGQYLSPKHLGLGLGFFIEYYFLNYIFDNFEFEKINSEILSNNKKNIRLHDKLGFLLEKDVYHYSMLKADWEINSNKFEEIGNNLARLTPPPKK